jgi:GNAT superfamily N-acetyltransferase
MMAGAASVREAVERDVDALGGLLADAFEDDPAYRFLLPPSKKRPRSLADFFARNLRTHLPYRCTHVLVDEGGAILGTVTLRPPGGVPITLFTLVRRGLLPFVARNGPMAVSRLLKVKGIYDDLEREMIGAAPHRLVHMMVVRRDVQGSGFGKQMLSSVLRERSDLPVVLTTHNEGNVSFYRRLGFDVTRVRELARPQVPDPYTVWCMQRPGGGSSARQEVGERRADAGDEGGQR